ncbi:MAG: hypothetical protein KAS71_04890 [Bacteroidales bacterium]|nr:hypothetical protein [Bacteroidales bacterium]
MKLLNVLFLFLIVQGAVAQNKELIEISESYISSFVTTKNAKVELINFLKKKYSAIARLNDTWGTSYKSWEALLNSTQRVKGKTPSKDLLEFEKNNAHTGLRRFVG